jgi:hypothetical protein
VREKRITTCKWVKKGKRPKGKEADSPLKKMQDELAETPYLQAYKVFEKHAPKAFGPGTLKPTDNLYWTIIAEAIVKEGESLIYESRESLLKPVKGHRWRPKWHEAVRKSLMQSGYRKDILKIFPEKCNQCGFHRFFGIKSVDWSIYADISIICPNCETELAKVEQDPNKW